MSFHSNSSRATPPSADSSSKDLSKSEMDSRGDYYLKDEFVCSNSHSNSPKLLEKPSAATSKVTSVSSFSTTSTSIIPSSSANDSSLVDSESDALVIDDEDHDDGSDNEGERDKNKKKRKRDSTEDSKKNKEGETEVDVKVETTNGGESPSKKKKKDSDKKFQQVENELEALFAGVESEDGECVAIDENKSKLPATKPKKVKKEPKKKTEKVLKNSNNNNNAGNSTNNFPRKPGKKKKKKKISEQELLLEKYKGPFVRIRGPDVANPVWSNVINSPFDSIHPDDGLNTLDRISDSVDQRNFPQPSVTFSKFDPKNPDDSWLCIFCKKNSHYKGLGDLFGPYFISPEVASLGTPKKTKSESAAKFILGGDTGSKKRKRKTATSPLTASTTPNASKDGEIWFHEDCLCWMQDIQMVGHDILGLEEAVRQANEVKCVKCGMNGAVLCCCQIACKRVIHYPCAIAAKWKLDEDEFQAFCENHKEQKKEGGS